MFDCPLTGAHLKVKLCIVKMIITVLIVLDRTSKQSNSWKRNTLTTERGLALTHWNSHA